MALRERGVNPMTHCITAVETAVAAWNTLRKERAPSGFCIFNERLCKRAQAADPTRRLPMEGIGVQTADDQKGADHP